jgi:hypothetical protein
LLTLFILATRILYSLPSLAAKSTSFFCCFSCFSLCAFNLCLKSLSDFTCFSLSDCSLLRCADSLSLKSLSAFTCLSLALLALFAAFSASVAKPNSTFAASLFALVSACFFIISFSTSIASFRSAAVSAKDALCCACSILTCACCCSLSCLYAELTPLTAPFAFFWKPSKPVKPSTPIKDAAICWACFDTFKRTSTVSTNFLFNFSTSPIDLDSPGILNSSAIYYVRALHSL